MNHSTRIALAIAAFTLVGCTAEPGNPMPANTPSTVTSGNEPSEDKSYGAPRVSDPIEAAAFIENPCSVLTIDQTATLKLEKEGTPKDLGSKDPYCTWNSDDDREHYTFGWLASNKNGLADTYRADRSDPDFAAYFEPVTVSGYPGVFEDGKDRRDGGECNMVVGVRDELTFRVGSTRGPGKKSCENIKAIAEQAIATMKTGA
ncbi:DUF3558 domain-containing protein [Actinokineospora sp.]|uniref:DUF3558 domain-containing protein n=1 Tax=Actinokineospora sp. TaxID=1872133 RepID=UPI003D6BCC0F